MWKGDQPIQLGNLSSIHKAVAGVGMNAAKTLLRVLTLLVLCRAIFNTLPWRCHMVLNLILNGLAGSAIFMDLPLEIERGITGHGNDAQGHRVW